MRVGEREKTGEGGSSSPENKQLSLSVASAGRSPQILVSHEQSVHTCACEVGG